MTAMANPAIQRTSREKPREACDFERWASQIDEYTKS